MSINTILEEKGMTKYRLAKQSGVPHATLNDICSGKTSIGKCSAETLYRIARALDVSMESLIKDDFMRSERERSYEYGLPEYLQHDLDAYKKGAIDWLQYVAQFLPLMEKRHAPQLFKTMFGKYERVCLLCSEPTPEQCHRRLLAEIIESAIEDVTIVHL